MSPLAPRRKQLRDSAKLATTLAASREHLTRGRAAAARAELERARAIAPEHVDVVLLDAMLCLAAGLVERANGLLAQVLERDPVRSEALRLHGQCALCAGQDADACDRFERYLEIAHDDVDAWISLGLARRRAGRADAAVAAYERALALDACSLAVLINLGNVRLEQGEREHALGCYRQACALYPDTALAHYHLGVALRATGDDRGARTSFERALELDPRYVAARFNLANVLCDLGAPSDAAEHLRLALQQQPDDLALRLRCAALLAANDHADESLDILRLARAAAPNDAAVHNNLGLALVQTGQIEAALAAYDRALQLEPNGSARLNRAFAHLLAGRYRQGFADYEARWNNGALLAPIESALGVPRWDGAPLAGKTLVIVGEQGLGDEIMFASLLPEIIEQAGHVIVQCAVKLERLFARSFPRAQIVGFERSGTDWPQRLAARVRAFGQVDCYTALGSLPLQRRTSIASFPRHRGYVRADPDRVTYWRARLAMLGAGARIGISWRGGTGATGHNRRSVSLAALAPLLRAPDTHVVSLQYTDCAAELAAFERASGIRIAHWPHAIDDYDETAALVCALDQVVSVCTSVVHLCGALNVPVSVLAPKVPEWRYGLAGDRMPWYSSVTIVRQSQASVWSDVIAKLAGMLAGQRAAAPERSCERATESAGGG